MQLSLYVTAQCITVLNLIYKFMSSGNKAAAIIYRTKPDMKQLFDLPAPKKKEKEV